MLITAESYGEWSALLVRRFYFKALPKPDYTIIWLNEFEQIYAVKAGTVRNLATWILHFNKVNGKVLRITN